MVTWKCAVLELRLPEVQTSEIECVGRSDAAIHLVIPRNGWPTDLYCIDVVA